MFDSAASGELFLAYVERVLVNIAEAGLIAFGWCGSTATS
jgi:hypothetical protein